jgi:HMG (high mobility group) box
MCYTDAKKRQILTQNESQKDEDVLKIVAIAWKELDDAERAYWDEEARNDKVRYAITTSGSLFCCTIKS